METGAENNQNGRCSMNTDPGLQPDDRSTPQTDTTCTSNEHVEGPVDLFAELLVELVAEWRPVGYTQWDVVVELAGLYLSREQIRPPHVQVVEGSKPAPGLKGGDAEPDTDTDTDKDAFQEANLAAAQRSAWEVSPQEQARKQRADLDDLIVKKIQQFIFLRTAKTKLRDLSSQRSTDVRSDRARLPRGDYRIHAKDRANSKSAASAPSDQTAVNR